MKKRIEVIVVDDEASVRKVLQMLLERSKLAEFSVTTFEKPVDALPHIAEHPPHILFSDYEMPGMHGPELLRRTAEVSPATKTILMTGRDYEERATEAASLNAIFLAKPANLETVREILATILEQLEQT